MIIKKSLTHRRLSLQLEVNNRNSEQNVHLVRRGRVEHAEPFQADRRRAQRERLRGLGHKDRLPQSTQRLGRRRRIQARAFGRDVRATRQEHVLRQTRHSRVRLEAVLDARVHASIDDHRSGRVQFYSNHQLEPNRVERRETVRNDDLV